MKSLLDIQQDLRGLDKSIQEITKNLQNVQKDIENIRSSREDLSALSFDSEKLGRLAGKIPYKGHPLSRMKDANACMDYLEILIHLARLDTERENVLNRMIFLKWLLNQAGYDWSLEELYQDCLQMDEDRLQEILERFPNKWREYVIVDAIILANLCQNKNQEIQEYVADLIMILGLDKTCLKGLCVIAKIALCQNVDDLNNADEEIMTVLSLPNLKQHKHYVSADMVRQLREKNRQVIVRLQGVTTKDFKWIVSEVGTWVDAGEVVAEQKIQRSSGTYTKKMKATVPGWVFFGRIGKLYYAVISDWNDTQESIEEWVRET